ncbi:sulfotransferase family 2 domain-containing protein [Salibaculum sp.]|uniref:sulfotransferase family 2 domain-containing protein n=1 Tax=Salibaculum sp. TaxID=2855480 RepID=UPI002B47EFB7|nr:sulfotransferase family 2 domain-containing protein [Salibaculum sp.]HKL69567.1 sulfotransferase family 2 domain-containing protein [Salibaculum sp.]
MTTGSTIKKGFKRTIRRMGFDIVKAKRFPPNEIHFLHIGKNAGTQIKRISEVISEGSPNRPIVSHTHDFFLKHLPPKAKYFFSLRDPVSRFKSGFYSQKNHGRPAFNVPWSSDEEITFQEFEHANDLAESLFVEGDLGMKAWAAINSIRHTAQHQSDWFYLRGNFLQLTPPVWIIRQENFDEDLEIFLARAGYDIPLEDLVAPPQSTASNRNDYSDIPPISDKGKENLRRWYAQDFELYRACEDWLDAQKAEMRS